jgi:MFS family permease
MNAAMQAMENMQYARKRWLILATVAVAQFMIVLDLTIVNVALPSAQRSLHFATMDRQWVVTAYALAFGSVLLLGGRLADLLGRKVTFMAGLVAEGLNNNQVAAACTSAPTPWPTTSARPSASSASPPATNSPASSSSRRRTARRT